MKIVFYGTPEFAVPSLEILVENGFDIAAVVTVPDKPSGRGLKIQTSAVKQFALQHGLKILQPENLKDETFLSELNQLAPELQVVVAFRKMPEAVWSLPSKGTFNLHGSLLPQYRGAAPIQRAVMNGETETGVTTFFLEKEIDTGKIIFQEKIPIGENENAGELHDRMSLIGAALVLKTAKAISAGTIASVKQEDSSELKKAPKILKEDCRIDWTKSCKEIYNQIRGLSPYPGAFTHLLTPNEERFILKIFNASFEEDQPSKIPETILTDSSSFLKIVCQGGSISIHEVQLEGKRKMTISEFLRGNRITNDHRVL